MTHIYQPINKLILLPKIFSPNLSRQVFSPAKCDNQQQDKTPKNANFLLINAANFHSWLDFFFFNRKWTGTFSKTCNSKKAIRKMWCISAASYAERKIQREKKPPRQQNKKRNQYLKEDAAGLKSHICIIAAF